MVRTGSAAWIPVTLLILGGCKDKPVPQKAPRAAAEFLAELPAAANLAEQLAAEAAGRPTNTPKAEAIFEALAKAGVAPIEPRQFLGRTVYAMYCFGGTTAKASAVTVCEYLSPEAALAGVQHAKEQFASVPNRIFSVNQKTVLTVAGADASEAAKAVEIFSGL
jgi:hypothetical protein